MSATRTSTKKPTRNGAATAPQPKATKPSTEVLTATEAAEFLRIAESEILRLAKQDAIPGRLVGKEWRFLKEALRDWLRSPSSHTSKQALLDMAGKFKDDPFLEGIVQEAYRQRG